MQDEGLSLSELLCARLCHDLVGPIAAVGTGAELLAEEDGQALAGEALRLMAASAQVAAVRLKVLRLALGNAGGSMSSSALRGLVAGYLVATDAAAEQALLDWQDEGTAPWPGQDAKLLLNLVLLARESLPRGGTLTVRAFRRENGPFAELLAESPHAKPGAGLRGLAVETSGGLDARGAQAYYTARLAARQGLSVTSSVERGRVSLRAIPASL